ncbi:hypothetical protein [Falsiroseomonas oryziterrae]|uniref:hypothetical protein n=1 Tax=Falsiroseomonas oryziterrae TaxID=2911368 RepID=UPI001F452D3A|nr:hypothetical protein [Roseomonas sp. NPKOSM-4]
MDAPPLRHYATGVAWGAGALALPILLQVALGPVLGDGFILFLLFFLCLIPCIGVAFVWAGVRLWLLFPAALLLVFVPFASLIWPEARVIGTVPEATLAEMAARRAPAGFRLPDAAPLVAAARSVNAASTSRPTDLRGRRGAPVTIRGDFTVVPIVGPGWSPDQPVLAVGVVDSAEAPAWAASGGLLRLLPDRLREVAVRDALEQAGLVAAPGLEIGRWVASPGWARLDAAMPLLALYGAAVLAWGVLVGIAGAIDRRDEARAPRRRLARR